MRTIRVQGAWWAVLLVVLVGGWAIAQVADDSAPVAVGEVAPDVQPVAEEPAPAPVEPAADVPAEMPAETAPAEWMPMEEAVTDAVPAETMPAPVEEAPAEIAPVEEVPAEAVPAEVPPEEFAPAETPVEMPTEVPAEAMPESAPVMEETVAPAEPAPAPAAEELAPAVESAPAEELVPVEPVEAQEVAPEGLGPQTELIELETESTLPGGAQVEEEKGQELITITLDNVPLQDVVRMFTRISGANIVSGTNLTGNVTVNLQNVEWKPALSIILDSVSMVLVEKSPGIFVIMSKQDLAGEPLTMETFYLRYTTVTNVMPVLQKMLTSTNASVAGFPGANALVVQETPERLNKIKEVLVTIDRARSQVFIEAKFVELNDSAIKDLGINWKSLEGYTLTAGSMSWGMGEQRDWLTSREDTLQQTDTRRNTDTASRGYDMDFVQTTGGRTVEDVIDRTRTYSQNISDSFVKQATDVRAAILTASDFQVTLSALKQQDGATVVSNPKIVVASGDKATIDVLRKEPNISVTEDEDASGGGTSYKAALDEKMPYLESGVKVEVTPTVNTESNIAVKIIPELSRPTGERMEPQPGQFFSVLTSTRVETDFTLESGRTVAIGGLTRTDDIENITKIPLLGDIPILGKYLFRHTHKEKTQSEVVIFVTVSLAKPESITTSVGIPSTGRLIHQHLAREVAGGSEADGKRE